MKKQTKTKATVKTVVRTKKAAVKTIPKRKAATEKKRLVKTGNDAITKIPIKIENAPAEMAFWVNYGPVIRDIPGLKDALSEMPDDTYVYHANMEKNDFADWIEYVFADKDLADALRHCSDRSKAAQVVTRYIEYYNL